MERHFDEDLNALNSDILEMASLVEETISEAIKALKERDEPLAARLIQNDQKVDELELAIEQRCMTLLALQQPTAIDLRFITTAMKLNEELERIADLAVDVAQRVLELVKYPLLKPLIDIPKLAVIAQRMVNRSIDAFITRDVELAKEVVLSDSQADHLRNLIQEELIADYMAKDGSTVPRALPLLLIARHLERICDHAANIAEDVVYLVKGKSIKHRVYEKSES